MGWVDKITVHITVDDVAKALTRDLRALVESMVQLEARIERLEALPGVAEALAAAKAKARAAEAEGEGGAP